MSSLSPAAARERKSRSPVRLVAISVLLLSSLPAVSLSRGPREATMSSGIGFELTAGPLAPPLNVEHRRFEASLEPAHSSTKEAHSKPASVRRIVSELRRDTAVRDRP